MQTTDAPLGVSAPAARAAGHARAGIAGWSIGTLALTAGLSILAFLWLMPIAWIILTALKP